MTASGRIARSTESSRTANVSSRLPGHGVKSASPASGHAPTGYSLRNAANGSTRDARLAGDALAIAATASNSAPIPMNVAGSVGSVSKRMARRTPAVA